MVIDDSTSYPDNGCKYAQSYLLNVYHNGHRAKCQSCPFPNCLEEYTGTEISYMKRHREIRQVLSKHYQNIPTVQISNDIKLPCSTIREWIVKKKRIENLFRYTKHLLQYVEKV